MEAIIRDLVYRGWDVKFFYNENNVQVDVVQGNLTISQVAVRDPGALEEAMVCVYLDCTEDETEFKRCENPSS